MHTTPYARRAPSLLALALTSFLILGTPPPSPLSAQSPGNAPLSGGSLPLRGATGRAPDQEGAPRLVRAPSGQLFRVWRQSTPERASAIVLDSSPDGVAWKILTQINPEEAGVSPQEAQVAVSESGDLALAYRIVRDAPKIKHLRVVRSTDQGRTWTPPSANLDSTGGPFGPQIAWGEGRSLVLAWLDEGSRGRYRFDILMRRSVDGGATWEPEVQVTRSSAQRMLSYGPRLVGDGKGRFWLLWISSRDGRSSVSLIRSVDNGKTWTAPEQVTDQAIATYGQSLEVAPGGKNLLLTWRAQRAEGQTGGERPSRIFARSSRDGGATWSPVVEPDGLPSAAGTSAAEASSVLTAGGEAWVAWYDNRNGRNDIFVARSPDGGGTWGDAIRLDADGAGISESRSPKLAVSPDGTAVGVVWEDDREGPEAIYARIFSGGRWSAETRLGPPASPKRQFRNPSIVATSKDAFYVAWETWDSSQRQGPQRSFDGAVIHLGAPSGS